MALCSRCTCYRSLQWCTRSTVVSMLCHVRQHGASQRSSQSACQRHGHTIVTASVSTSHISSTVVVPAAPTLGVFSTKAALVALSATSTSKVLFTKNHVLVLLVALVAQKAKNYY